MKKPCRLLVFLIFVGLLVLCPVVVAQAPGELVVLPSGVVLFKDGTGRERKLADPIAVTLGTPDANSRYPLALDGQWFWVEASALKQVLPAGTVIYAAGDRSELVLDQPLEVVYREYVDGYFKFSWNNQEWWVAEPASGGRWSFLLVILLGSALLLFLVWRFIHRRPQAEDTSSQEETLVVEPSLPSPIGKQGALSPIVYGWLGLGVRPPPKRVLVLFNTFTGGWRLVSGGRWGVRWWWEKPLMLIPTSLLHIVVPQLRVQILSGSDSSVLPAGGEPGVMQITIDLELWVKVVEPGLVANLELKLGSDGLSVTSEALGYYILQKVQGIVGPLVAECTLADLSRISADDTQAWLPVFNEALRDFGIEVISISLMPPEVDEDIQKAQAVVFEASQQLLAAKARAEAQLTDAQADARAGKIRVKAVFESAAAAVKVACRQFGVEFTPQLLAEAAKIAAELSMAHDTDANVTVIAGGSGREAILSLLAQRGRESGSATPEEGADD